MTPAPVGFDLDMTLIDSQRAILASFAAVAADTGMTIEPEGVLSRLGVKLQDELAHWFPPARSMTRSGSTEPTTCGSSVPAPPSCPGRPKRSRRCARPARRAVVITAKAELPARLSLDSVGLRADEIVADAHGPEKAAVLTLIGAVAYVGDTPADMAAAVTAGIHPVGVATGSFGEAELRAAGAADVLSSLADFPALYRKITA